MISENLKNYFYLFRFDHSIKQIFVIPGILIALSLGYQTDFSNLLIGFACIQLAASSNYIINEWLDRDFDKHNPQKKIDHRLLVKYKVNLFTQYIFLQAH